MNSMTAQIDRDRTGVPLCVDLDGTLIRTDLLFEAVLRLLRRNILFVFLMPLWLLRGKSHLKDQIARRTQINPATLPYNETVLAWLRTEKANGRKLVLATASHHSYADAIARHIGLFDAVEASDENTNLSSAAKAQRLERDYGKGGFDYAGNSRADYAVWDMADRAIVVGDDPVARRYVKRDKANTLPEPARTRSRLILWLKAIRIHQWLKNSLLFVPAVLGARYFDLETIWPLILAFVSFGFCASSVYLLNDLTDIDVDRGHPTKFKRPIPAGDITIPQAALGSFALLSASILLSLMLPALFTLVLLTYYCVTCAYSFVLKRHLLIDVLALAGLFTIRVIAGAAVIGGAVSAWLLAFCMFFFLSLALVKRFVEILIHKEEVGRAKTGRGYRSVDLETLGQGGMASGFAAVVVLALFIDSDAVRVNYNRPEMLWLVCPIVLYLIFRIWILARRNEMHDDPVMFLMKDWRSLTMIAAGALIMITSQLV